MILKLQALAFARTNKRNLVSAMIASVMITINVTKKDAFAALNGLKVAVSQLQFLAFAYARMGKKKCFAVMTASAIKTIHVTRKDVLVVIWGLGIVASHLQFLVFARTNKEKRLGAMTASVTKKDAFLRDQRLKKKQRLILASALRAPILAFAYVKTSKGN